jgi:Domain of unknown function (DUF6362)
MTVWTFDEVEYRFHEAAVTSHRLPPARVAGYVTMWPEIARQSWEGYADELTILRIPATPAAIDRLAETTLWLHWLSVEQRKLVWARARYVPWRVIGAQLGVPRQTAWRRWRYALTLIVVELNGQPPRIADAIPQRRAT